MNEREESGRKGGEATLANNGKQHYVKMGKLSALKREIVKLRQKNPQLKMSDIGRMVKCSREYVRQVLEKAKLRTKVQSVMWRVCPQCLTEFKYNHNSRQKFCSRECREESLYFIVLCAFCNKPLKRSIKEERRETSLPRKGDKLHFCNHKCQGKWLGKNYGKGKGGNELH